MLVDTIIKNSKRCIELGDFNAENFIKAQENLTIDLKDDEVLVVVLCQAGVKQMQNNNTMETWFDPVTRYEMLHTGKIGCLLGITFATDAFDQTSSLITNQMHVVSKNLLNKGK